MKKKTIDKLNFYKIQLDDLGRIVLTDPEQLKDIHGAIAMLSNSLVTRDDPNWLCVCNTQCALDCLCPHMPGCHNNYC
jgi:hypothetical protein